MDVKINSKLLKELRLAKSWSQELLAEKAGLSLRTVQRVETDGMASLQTRLALAKTLDIDPVLFDRQVRYTDRLKQLFSIFLSINMVLTVLFLAIVTTGVLSLLAGVRAFTLPEMTDLLLVFAFCITTSLALNGLGGSVIRFIGYANAILLSTLFVVALLYSFAPSETLFDSALIWRAFMPGLIGVAIFTGLESLKKNNAGKRL